MTIWAVASTIRRAAPADPRPPGAPIATIFSPATPISTAAVRPGMTATPPETIRSSMACLLTLVQPVPGMRVTGHLYTQRVDGRMRAAQQCPKVRPAERKIHRLLWPFDDADALTVRHHYPDAARPGAVHPAGGVDLQTIGDARLAAFVQIGKDAPPDHVAGRIERNRVNVFRRARVRHIHRTLIRREREPARVF